MWPALLYCRTPDSVSRIARNTVVQYASGMSDAAESSCSSNSAGWAPLINSARAELRS